MENNLAPRVICYFDDVFPDKHYVNEHNGVLLAIKEFNNENSSIKIGKSLDSINDFRFPIGRDKIFYYIILITKITINILDWIMVLILNLMLKKLD